MAKTVSVLFSRLSKYNFEYISLEEVLILELLLLHFQKNTIKTLITSKIADECGLKKTRVTTALEALEAKGFIEKEESKFRILFELKIDKVVDSLPRLFKKEYRNIYKIFLKIQNPDAFKNTANKLRKNNKEVPSKKSKSSKEQLPVQISLFD